MQLRSATREAPAQPSDDEEQFVSELDEEDNAIKDALDKFASLPPAKRREEHRKLFDTRKHEFKRVLRKLSKAIRENGAWQSEIADEEELDKKVFRGITPGSVSATYQATARDRTAEIWGQQTNEALEKIATVSTWSHLRALQLPWGEACNRINRCKVDRLKQRRRGTRRYKEYVPADAKAARTLGSFNLVTEPEARAVGLCFGEHGLLFPLDLCEGEAPDDMQIDQPLDVVSPSRSATSQRQPLAPISGNVKRLAPDRVNKRQRDVKRVRVAALLERSQMISDGEREIETGRDMQPPLSEDSTVLEFDPEAKTGAGLEFADGADFAYDTIAALSDVDPFLYDAGLDQEGRDDESTMEQDGHHVAADDTGVALSDVDAVLEAEDDEATMEQDDHEVSANDNTVALSDDDSVLDHDAEDDEVNMDHYIGMEGAFKPKSFLTSSEVSHFVRILAPSTWKIVDSGYVDVSSPERCLEKSPLRFSSSQNRVGIILHHPQPAGHWTFGWANRTSRRAHHFDPLGQSEYSENGLKAIVSFTKHLDRSWPASDSAWTYEQCYSFKQNTSWDCGTAVVVQALHLFAGESIPEIVDCNVWRGLFGLICREINADPNESEVEDAEQSLGNDETDLAKCTEDLGRTERERPQIMWVTHLILQLARGEYDLDRQLLRDRLRATFNEVLVERYMEEYEATAEIKARRTAISRAVATIREKETVKEEKLRQRAEHMMLMTHKFHAAMRRAGMGGLP